MNRTAARTRAVADTNSAVERLPEEVPKALQASECRELLDPTRASCLILAQHQPGKFSEGGLQGRLQPNKKWQKVLVLWNNPFHNKKMHNEEEGLSKTRKSKSKRRKRARAAQSTPGQKIVYTSRFVRVILAQGPC